MFKKKQKQTPERIKFTYSILMRNGEIHRCKGMAVSKNSLALALSDNIEDFNNMYFTLEDDTKILLWTKEIENIKID